MRKSFLLIFGLLSATLQAESGASDTVRSGYDYGHDYGYDYGYDYDYDYGHGSKYPGSYYPKTTLIEAGPIWNNVDAQYKCPAATRYYGCTWTGQWHTVIYNRQSVCECY